MDAAGSRASTARGGAGKRMRWWYAIGLLLGVLRLLAATLPAAAAMRSAASIVLVVAAWLALIVAGRAAKRASLRPSAQAAAVGFCYGVPAGLVQVLFPPTPAQVAAALQKLQQKAHLTSAQLQLAQQRADAASAHWEGFVFAIVAYVLLGLLLGWIGSLLAGGAEDSRAV